MCSYLAVVSVNVLPSTVFDSYLLHWSSPECNKYCFKTSLSFTSLVMAFSPSQFSYVNPNPDNEPPFTFNLLIYFDEKHLYSVFKDF